MAQDIRERMFQDLDEKDIFEQANNYAFEYTEAVLERNVFPTVEALKDLERFVENLPLEMGDASGVLEQLHRYGSPATVAHTGGRYFGFVTGAVIPVALAARLLSDYWDQNAAMYVGSPIAAKLETVCETWVRDLLGLSEQVVAGFVSGSSMAIFCGLAAARYRVFQNNNWDINRKGLNGAPKVRIVAGRQAHSTVLKAIALLGFGIDNIEWVDTDDQGRIIPSEVPDLDVSTILILQAGNVCSGAFDPFLEICQKASAANAWVHIDGAFGLWAAASENLKHLTTGMQMANSWSVDGHKTLNTPYDSGIVLCKDKDALIHALHATGSYLSFSSDNRDGMLYTPEMSRRARSIELWAALKFLGKKGIDELIFGFHLRALQANQEFANEGFRILNEIVFNQVLVACDSDETTNATMHNLQKSGECWVGGAMWHGKAVIRVSVCSWATTEADITRTVKAFVVARQKAIQE